MLKKIITVMMLMAYLIMPITVFAEEAPTPAGQPAATEAAPPAQTGPSLDEVVSINKVALDTVWVLVTAFLVFWMNAGFALVESGLCRAKNTVNILAKNFVVFAIASIAFSISLEVAFISCADAAFSSIPAAIC